eukprot:6189230-Pleurochrysis_carterae.AAC.1
MPLPPKTSRQNFPPNLRAKPSRQCSAPFRFSCAVRAGRRGGVGDRRGLHGRGARRVPAGAAM